VWATAPTFGPPGACNDATIYVLLFVNVRATVGWLRWIFVTVEAIALFALVYVPIVVILELRNSRNNQVAHDERPESNSMDVARVGEASALERGSISSHPRSGLELQRIGGPSDTTARREQSVTEAVHPCPRKASTAQSTVSNNNLYFQTSSANERGPIGRFLTSVYGVTMLELTIHRNKKHVIGDENQWAFGQIAAMVIAIASLNGVLQLLLPGQNRRGKKKSECIHSFITHQPKNIDSGTLISSVGFFDAFTLSSRKSCSNTPETPTPEGHIPHVPSSHSGGS
jgi:hypothetical protein